MRRYVLILAFMVSVVPFLMADAAPAEVLTISEDRVHVGVAPWDPISVSVNLTLRNRFPEAVTFFISLDVSRPDWGVEGPDRISLGALDQRTFTVSVMPPKAEDAGTEAVLTVTASEVDRGTWTQRCTFIVLPFSSFVVIAPEDVMVDMPLSGSFNVTVRNEGNVPAAAVLSCADLGLDEVLDILDPGSESSVIVPYDLDSDIDTTIGAASGDRLEVRFVLDGERFHILFDRDRALVLLPSLVGGYNNVRVLAIGGEATDVEFHSDGLRIETEGEVNVQNLARAEVHLTVVDSPGRRIAPVRATAIMGGRTISSNPVPLSLMGYEKNTDRVVDPGIVAAGGAGAIALLTGSLGYLYAASETFRYRWLLISVIPLYSMVKGEKVLDHFFRGRLYEYIRENPGVTFTALKNHFEVNNGNLTYHLHRLEKEELISSKNVGKFKVFYPDGIRLRGCEIVISLMDKEILDIVAENPGIPTVKVVEKLSSDRSRRTVSRHIKELQRKGLIDIYDVEGVRKIYLSGEYGSVLLSGQGVVDITPARV